MAAKVNDVMERKEAKKRGCPFHTNKATVMAKSWWPESLNLRTLPGAPPASAKNLESSYAEAFKTVDVDELKKDVLDIMKKSQSWWPADYGHYGPFFVRLAWHAAGTYRTFDGRGGSGKGAIRLAPLNSWPDNGNLDKARRLLWPVKKKYGSSVSWADLMIFAGTVGMEDMGLPMFGFGFGRVDAWEPEQDIYWGPEQTWLAAERGGLGDKLEQPLGAVQMGLIYVNPEGPGGNPDPLQSAQDIRTTFGRMAMNDEETVALIAGGHTFGKAHGAAPGGEHQGPEPEGAKIEEQGFGWTSDFKSGAGEHAITSGLEGAWTANPTKWDNGYFENLFKYEWKQTKSPAGATQWIPTDESAAELVPGAFEGQKREYPIMFTTDLALKMDPAYNKISKAFHENPDKFADAFGRAWYKLCHRDMGPVSKLVGKYVPPAQIWQDPIDKPAFGAPSDEQVAELKAKILADSGASPAALVRAAWASAATYRCTDLRGGTNGGRVRLAPQKDWKVNDPEELAATIAGLEGVQKAFNEANAGANVGISMADIIVLGGSAAVEAAARAAGHDGFVVPFKAGRGDATDEQTDAASFAVLEPTSDGFRNFSGPALPGTPADMGAKTDALLVDRAQMLSLSKSEMTVLIGGLRVLNANTGGSDVGVLTATPGQLTNDFFVNLLDMSTKWEAGVDGVYNGNDRSSGEPKWKASRVDLVFGSNSELRMIAEYYAADDAKTAFVNDFCQAWCKVMNIGREF